MCIQILLRTGGDHLIHNHLVLRIFNILLVRLTRTLLLCTCVFLLNIFCLVIMIVRVTIPYGSDPLSDNTFVVILFIIIIIILLLLLEWSPCPKVV